MEKLYDFTHLIFHYAPLAYEKAVQKMARRKSTLTCASSVINRNRSIYWATQLISIGKQFVLINYELIWRLRGLRSSFGRIHWKFLRNAGAVSKICEI